ncbi:hypothetical protein N7448_002977 [Penicillium atrosanguineum]|uniref:Uncharacterized protein n=1 Tax=Penicillium atrosanguineum TaxID=1132637 RepID=A0A9W9H6K6_9EURO|nr:hypothetical protein N7526_008783 [Penicillium atrosanguineum]KAJ5139569.1 hypothetical protein N7448_002977 [Penicillium atrosanguineum]KAJ5315012.1 hypothetical protein N7476_005319 [Penicillium atrosanguineum]
MVYRGKPSNACERCRTRRLKCDQGSPACTQCMRARVDCPGYRDLLDLGFRDQSQEVIRKSQRITRKQQRTVPIVARAAEDTTEDTAEDMIEDPVACTAASPFETGGLSPRRGPAYPVQELAKGYLFSHYMSGGPRGGHMSYLIPLINDPRNSAVNAALNAVGLAALSNIRLAPQMMLKARREYTIALSQTNHALKDSIMSKRDDILAAVVLLGMFEVMTCTDDSFIDRWMKHMEGAAKLIEFRGPEQLTRQEGLDMFTQLRAQIVSRDRKLTTRPWENIVLKLAQSVSKIYREQYSSPMLAQLTESAKLHRNPEDQIQDNLGLLVIRLSNFCASLKNKTITEPSEILRTALTIDAELMALFISVPQSWNYQTVKVPILDGEHITQAVWGDNYHVYSNLAASSMWNNYRSARILVHELIIDTVKDMNALGYDDNGHQQRSSLANQSRQIAQQLVEDICASVPFHFGADIEDDQMFESSSPAVGDISDLTSWDFLTGSFPIAPSPWSPMAQHNSGPSSSSADSIYHSFTAPFTDPTASSGSGAMWESPSSPFEVTGAGGVTLVWPLLIAANSGLASDDLRKWITGCFDKIGHSMGINQALAMAQLLRKGMHSRAWLTPENGSPSFNT